MITRHTVRLGAVLSLAMLGACKGAPDVLKPGPKEIAQHGFRGVGMETNYDPDDIAKTAAYNQAPKALRIAARQSSTCDLHQLMVLRAISMLSSLSE